MNAKLANLKARLTSNDIKAFAYNVAVGVATGVVTVIVVNAAAIAVSAASEAIQNATAKTEPEIEA